MKKTLYTVNNQFLSCLISRMWIKLDQFPIYFGRRKQTTKRKFRHLSQRPVETVASLASKLTPNVFWKNSPGGNHAKITTSHYHSLVNHQWQDVGLQGTLSPWLIQTGTFSELMPSAGGWMLLGSPVTSFSQMWPVKLPILGSWAGTRCFCVTNFRWEIVYIVSERSMDLMGRWNPAGCVCFRNMTC